MTVVRSGVTVVRSLAMVWMRPPVRARVRDDGRMGQNAIVAAAGRNADQRRDKCGSRLNKDQPKIPEPYAPTVRRSQ